MENDAGQIGQRWLAGIAADFYITKALECEMWFIYFSFATFQDVGDDLIGRAQIVGIKITILVQRFRMAQGQVFLNSFIRTVLKPSNWLKFPAVIIASVQTIDTDIPLWQLPRVLVSTVRSFLFKNIDYVILQREMVVPWVTPAGAQVLLPDWPQIQPAIQNEFGQ